MKLRAFPKTIFCMVVLLCWASCTPPAMAQNESRWRSIVIISPLQPVEVHTLRGSYTANFESAALVSRNGNAGGLMTFPSSGGGVNVIFLDGSVRFHDGIVTGVILRGRAADGHEIFVSVRPEPSEDCLIYTTIGTDYRYATWEAHGRIVVNRN